MRRLHVHRLHAAPRGGVEIAQPGAVEDSGRMHEGLARPEPLDDRSQRLLIGKIHREFPGAVEDRDGVSGVGQRSDDRSADPAVSSGDRRHQIARLAPLIPQLAFAWRRRSGEIPAAVKQAGRYGERQFGMLISLPSRGRAPSRSRRSARTRPAHTRAWWLGSSRAPGWSSASTTSEIGA
jgi:hypothetical protein